MFAQSHGKPRARVARGGSVLGAIPRYSCTDRSAAPPRQTRTRPTVLLNARRSLVRDRQTQGRFSDWPPRCLNDLLGPHCAAGKGGCSAASYPEKAAGRGLDSAHKGRARRTLAGPRAYIPIRKARLMLLRCRPALPFLSRRAAPFGARDAPNERQVAAGKVLRSFPGMVASYRNSASLVLLYDFPVPALH